MNAYRKIINQHEKLKTILQEIPASTVINPSGRSGNYILHTKKLLEQIQKDKTEFQEAGLTIEFYNQLQYKATYCQLTDLEYNEEQEKKEGIINLLNEKTREQNYLKAELLGKYANGLSFSKEDRESGRFEKEKKAEVNEATTFATIGTIVPSITAILTKQQEYRILEKASKLAEEIYILNKKYLEQEKICDNYKNQRNRAYTYLQKTIECLICFTGLLYIHKPERQKKYKIIGLPIPEKNTK